MMVLTIPNADSALLKVLKGINEKLVTPYEIIEEDELGDILLRYNGAFSYEEIKKQMDTVLDGYKRGDEGFNDLGWGWH